MSSQALLQRFSGPMEYEYLTMVITIQSEIVMLVNREQGIDALEAEFLYEHKNPTLKIPMQKLHECIHLIDDYFSGSKENHGCILIFEAGIMKKIELLENSDGKAYEHLTVGIEIDTHRVVTVNQEGGLDNLEIEFFNGHDAPTLTMPYAEFKQLIGEIDSFFENLKP